MTTAIQLLERKGLIRAGRRVITIVDRKGLLKFSNGAYEGKELGPALDHAATGLDTGEGYAVIRDALQKLAGSVLRKLMIGGREWLVTVDVAQRMPLPDQEPH